MAIEWRQLAAASSGWERPGYARQAIARAPARPRRWPAASRRAAGAGHEPVVASSPMACDPRGRPGCVRLEQLSKDIAHISALGCSPLPYLVAQGCRDADLDSWRVPFGRRIQGRSARPRPPGGQIETLLGALGQPVEIGVRQHAPALRLHRHRISSTYSGRTSDAAAWHGSRRTRHRLFHGDDFERGSVGVGAREEDQVVAFGGWVEWADAVFRDLPRSLVTDPMSRGGVSEDDKHPMSPLCRTQHRCQEWSAESVGGQPGAVFRMIPALEPRSREFVARCGREPAPLPIRAHALLVCQDGWPSFAALALDRLPGLHHPALTRR